MDFSAIGSRTEVESTNWQRYLKDRIRCRRETVEILSEKSAECNATQLEAIRELMLAASKRGEWLTLAEIAEPTEFGEASISAQLRHLRKPQHGAYCVEKRRRRSGTDGPLSTQAHGAALFAACDALWEYRVFTTNGAHD
jgi:hypothetical protein